MVSARLYDLLINPNIDRYLNPYIPPNCLAIFPRPITRFLGYRERPGKEPPSSVQWVLTVLANIAGLCVVGAVYNYAGGITQWHPPPMIASLGASAVLYYNAINAPLAQPRNGLIGHTLSAIVGVGISKLFQHDPVFFANYSWVVSAVACAGATLIMSMTNTVNPPGGATAILACTEAQIIAMGWMFPPIILLASVLMVGVALVFNNTFRRYPTFWWTPEEVGGKLHLQRNKPAEEKMEDGKDEEDVEKGDVHRMDAMSQVTSETDSERTLKREASHEFWFRDGLEAIHIAPHRIMLPAGLVLRDDEAELLRSLMRRLGSTAPSH